MKSDGTALDDLLKRVEETETGANHRKQIKEIAEASFKDHVIVEEAPGVFHCAKPNTGMYSFRVAFLPAGLIVVYGDCGDMMLQRGGENWLSGAIRHDYVSDYVFEKALPRLTRSERKSEFMPGEAVAELRRIHDGVPFRGVELPDPSNEEDWEEQPNPKLAEKIAADWLVYSLSGSDGNAWDRAYFEHTDDCEPPTCRDYSANDLWCYYALSWFVRTRQKVVEEIR